MQKITRRWDVYAAEMSKKVLDESKKTKKSAERSFQVQNFKTSNGRLEVQNTRVQILLARTSAPMILNDSSIQFEL
eukprot:525139-Rhodomonas_salina.1